MTELTGCIGPILIVDTVQEDRLHLAALFVAPHDVSPADLTVEGQSHAAQVFATYPQGRLFRTRFSVSATEPSSYEWNGETYPLASNLSADLALGYVSCNGEEHGDMDREDGERNVMWARLCVQHRNAPFALLLHGGDQIYADEVTNGHPMSDGWPDTIPSTPTTADLASLRDHLRARFFERYVTLYSAPDFAWIAARVPSLMQWDDHDICDGWGSLPAQVTVSKIGQTLYAAAKEARLAFQDATTEADLPQRFYDASARSLGWTITHGALRLIAPDLRGTRSQHDVMAEHEWQVLEDCAAAPAPGRTFLLSSVPVLGPRLSLLERLMLAIPKMQKYEDDLRDQWQSRAHRASWQRLLRLIFTGARPKDQQLTCVSGEIHLCTRAVIASDDNQPIHQLVASGITHRPPPKIWARMLGALSTLGEAPLPGHPITFAPLPGQANRYTAERNFLTLRRTGGQWQAVWELEHSGTTPPLVL
jgi:hypothetical protein